MAPSTTTYVFAACAGGVILGAYLWYHERCLRLPTAEEQAWLDQQLNTPKHQVLSPGSQVSEEEQKWLDKQIEDSETADVRVRPCIHRLCINVIVRSVRALLPAAT